MKIKYLGTGASEGWPAVFCQCEPCKAARKLGGKNIRRRSSSVVDDRLLLDLCPDIYGLSLAFDVNLPEIKHILVTHGHKDHFYARELTNIAEAFAHILDGIPIRLYGSSTIMELAQQAIADYEMDGRLELVELQAYETFPVGDYMVTPLPANHGAGVSFNYIIRSGGKTMLYAHDTGWPLDGVWDHLKGVRLDLVSMDCTCLDAQHYESHMGIEQNIAMKRRLISMGSAGEGTAFVSNHFTHNGLLMHNEIEERLRPHGILAAYDGMEVAF